MNGIQEFPKSESAQNASLPIGTRKRNPNFKHGLTGTSFYGIWGNIKRRCLNSKSADFRYYGGRGIKLCDEWLDFMNFKSDMYKSYLEHKEKHKTTTIERINNDGNYEPSNCKWATRSEQNANSRAAKWFTAFSPRGETFQSKDQTAFGREHDLQQSLINKVLRGVLPHYKRWTFKYAKRGEM